MVQSVRLNDQEQEMLRKKAVELNKILIQNQEYLKVKLHYAVKNELYYLAHSIQKQIK